MRVEGVFRDADETRVVTLRTDDESAAACPACGVFSTSLKGRAVTCPKDLPYGEDRLRLRWCKSRWRCAEPLCGRGSFTESINEIGPGMRTTGRLRRSIASAVGDAARSVDEVATAHEVSWPTAHRAFCETATRVLGEPEPVTVLGIDETRRGRPRWVKNTEVARWVRVDPWDTGFVDLAGSQGLLGQTEGRTSKTVVDWLQARSDEFRSSIAYVAIDPAAAYAAAIRTPGLLPNATLVVDHFHIVKLAGDAVTAVRRRVIWETAGRRGRKTDPAWANRRRLLTGRERLSERGFAAMWNGLADSDPTSQIVVAWIAKEELRSLLALARTNADRELISRRLSSFYDWCARADIAELTTLATTVETWWPAILAFIQTGITNARTEGLNRLVKQVKRSACGFRNVSNQHRRVRFHCTRNHRAATATSTRLPGQS